MNADTDIRCPCCRMCQECKGFQKILDLEKNIGLVVYKHTKVEMCESGVATTSNVYILHNTKNAEIVPEDIVFDPQTVKCSKCRHRMQGAQKLLRDIPAFYNNVMSICEHCRKESQRESKPCSECHHILRRFVEILNKVNAIEREDLKYRDPRFRPTSLRLPGLDHFFLPETRRAVTGRDILVSDIAKLTREQESSTIESGPRRRVSISDRESIINKKIEKKTVLQQSEVEPPPCFPCLQRRHDMEDTKKDIVESPTVRSQESYMTSVSGAAKEIVPPDFGYIFPQHDAKQKTSKKLLIQDRLESAELVKTLQDRLDLELEQRKEKEREIEVQKHADTEKTKREQDELKKAELKKQRALEYYKEQSEKKMDISKSKESIEQRKLHEDQAAKGTTSKDKFKKTDDESTLDRKKDKERGMKTKDGKWEEEDKEKGMKDTDKFGKDKEKNIKDKDGKYLDKEAKEVTDKERTMESEDHEARREKEKLSKESQQTDKSKEKDAKLLEKHSKELEQKESKAKSEGHDKIKGSAKVKETTAVEGLEKMMGDSKEKKMEDRKEKKADLKEQDVRGKEAKDGKSTKEVKDTDKAGKTKQSETGSGKVGDQKREKDVEDKEKESYVKGSDKKTRDAKDVKGSDKETRDAKDIKGSDKESRHVKDVKGSDMESRDAKDVKGSDKETRDAKDVKGSDKETRDAMDVKGSDKESRDVKDVKGSDKESRDAKNVKGSDKESRDVKDVKGSDKESRDAKNVKGSDKETRDAKDVKGSDMEAKAAKDKEQRIKSDDKSVGKEKTEGQKDEAKIYQVTKRRDGSGDIKQKSVTEKSRIQNEDKAMKEKPKGGTEAGKPDKNEQASTKFTGVASGSKQINAQKGQSGTTEMTKEHNIEGREVKPSQEKTKNKETQVTDKLNEKAMLKELELLQKLKQNDEKQRREHAEATRKMHEAADKMNKMMAAKPISDGKEQGLQPFKLSNTNVVYKSREYIDHTLDHVKELDIKGVKVKKPSYEDFLLLTSHAKSLPKKTLEQMQSNLKRADIDKHAHHVLKDPDCMLCVYSDLALQVASAERLRRPKDIDTEIIVDINILKKRPRSPPKKEPKERKLLQFETTFTVEPIEPTKHDIIAPEVISKHNIHPRKKKSSITTPIDTSGVVQYALSDRSFIEKGWTLLPTEKILRKINVYRMRPARPEFDWFENHKHRRLIEYDTGEKFAEIDEDGRGKLYYRNGKLALNYYDAEETNAHRRFVIYSNGDTDERGRRHPVTVLATFDYLGNGVVFDHTGKIRLKYNQTEGVVLDRSLGPVSHWKWHSLNDPPTLQRVMIDTQMPHKDPAILNIVAPGEEKKIKHDNEEMLSIEFDNFIKEKNKKLTQKFKPFQIKMKALKINENFSLRVLDQATIYLSFRDGSRSLKMNLGMLLDNHEIVDTDIAELGEVSTCIDRLPAHSDSVANMQDSVSYAQRVDRKRMEHELSLRPAAPRVSADVLTAARSRPLRPAFVADSSDSVIQARQ